MTSTFKAVSCAAALSVFAAFSLPAAAQSAGSNVVNLGWFHFSPNDSSDPLQTTSPVQHTFTGSGATVKDSDTVGLALTHFFTDNFAVTADMGVPPKFKLNGTGTLSGLGELGSAKQWSPAIVAKWFFGDAESKFRPFIGAGVTYVWYSDVKLSQSLQNQLTSGTGTATADLSSSWAPVANIGATYNFDKNWSVALSVSYIPLKTDADITGITPGPTVKAKTSLTIDPLVTFLSVGYRF
ncbi:MAG TPA: OmpW family outer membrane protein [Herbaspirillum sp.]|jgi:outer membrane protein